MPWCPKCKCEYKKGITYCTDCDCPLTEQLEQKYDFESVVYIEKESGERLLELFHYSGIKEAVLVYHTESSNYEIQVDKKNYRKATDLLHIFTENEEDTNKKASNLFIDDDSGKSILSDNDSSNPVTASYEKKEEKYKDNLSSAYTFLICGVLGLLIVFLDFFGAIKLLSSTGSAKIVLSIVMGLFFMFFIIISIKSFLYSSKLKRMAKEENEFINELFKWLDETITIESIDASFDDSLAEVEKYFSRVAYIQDKIKSHTEDIDENFLSSMAEDYYNKLYE